MLPKPREVSEKKTKKFLEVLKARASHLLLFFETSSGFGKFFSKKYC